MISLKINQKIFVVKEDISILEACKFVGIKMPRFCYHDSLSIAGNCRMCLVKLELNDNLIISCLTRVESDMEILSEDPVIQKAREEILEFLLLDHPLDCPICDQAGECDLQDQAKIFGSSISKTSLNKISVEDKNFSVFIKSIMTRCIHCTRCVRFSTEIAGVDFFGTLNRGNFTEIGTYSDNMFLSEIGSNVIDLCPVGALTSKPYAFKARPWEVRSMESIDLSDGLGSNVYIHSVDSDIIRILPKYNSEINETIISDKARYFNDSTSSYNLLTNFFFYNNNEKKSISSLSHTVDLCKHLLNKKRVLIIGSEELNFETLSLARKISFMNPKVSFRVVNSAEKRLKTNVFINRLNLLEVFKTHFDNIFLLSTNPRTEAALINTRLRLLSNTNYVQIYALGLKVSLNLKTIFLNLNLNNILLFLEGRSFHLSSLLLKGPSLIVFGAGILERNFDIHFFYSFLKKINPSISFFQIRAKNNSFGYHFLNIKSFSSKELSISNIIIFLQTRETTFLNKIIVNADKKFSIFWLNSFSYNKKIKNGCQLPIKTIFEEVGTYFNTEFRPQTSNKIFLNKIGTGSSFSILKDLFEYSLSASNENNFIKNFIKAPDLFSTISLNQKYISSLNSFFFNLNIEILEKHPAKSIIPNFFKSNLYTDYSKNMALATKNFHKFNNNFL